MAGQVNISNFGDDFGKFFYLRKAPSLLLESEKRPQMAVTRLKLPNGLPEPTAPVRPERGFTINVHLQQPFCQGWGTWVDGRFFPISSWERGAIGIYDLESNPIALRDSAFDSVHFNLPRSTLDAFTIENGFQAIRTLTYPGPKRQRLVPPYEVHPPLAWRWNAYERPDVRSLCVDVLQSHGRDLR
jgi:hypothetical protein